MKYIFFDIDGTLTGSKTFGVIPESTKEALRLLEEGEHFYALATGRAHFKADEFASANKIGNYVCEGGQCLVLNGEVVSYEYPNQDVFHDIIDKCEALDIAYAVQIDDTPTRYTKDDRFEIRVNDKGFFMSNVIDEKIDFSKEKIRRIFVENNEEKLSVFDDLEDMCIMGYKWSKFKLIEPDDKYKGIKKMVEILGGKEEDIVVFGDGVNDIKMFQQAPFKIAMDNAIDELKELSDYVTHDSSEDGIYHALKRFGWI